MTIRSASALCADPMMLRATGPITACPLVTYPARYMRSREAVEVGLSARAVFLFPFGLDVLAAQEPHEGLHDLYQHQAGGS